MPHVGEMSGPAARNDEQRVDADVVTFAEVARGETFGGGDHAPQAPFVESERRRLLAGACLDLDKGKDSSPPGDDVDFTAGHSRASRQNLPAVETQEPAAKRLSASPALLRLLPVHLESSSARP